MEHWSDGKQTGLKRVRGPIGPCGPRHSRSTGLDILRPPFSPVSASGSEASWGRQSEKAIFPGIVSEVEPPGVREAFASQKCRQQMFDRHFYDRTVGDEFPITRENPCEDWEMSFGGDLARCKNGFGFLLKSPFPPRRKSR